MKADIQNLAALTIIGVIALSVCLGGVPQADAGLVGAIVTGLFALLNPRKGAEG